MLDSMPPLVDRPTPPFYPPPQGVADGGQPGLFGAFPGVRAQQPQQKCVRVRLIPLNGPAIADKHYPSLPPIMYPHSPYTNSAYPAWPTSPVSAPASTPWGYQYPPAATPHSAPGWGPLSPGSSSTGYPPGPGAWHPPTPYFTGQPPPSTPYEPTVFSATGGGWYDTPPATSAADGGGYFVGTPKRKKRRGSGYYDDYDFEDDDGYLTAMKRTHSQTTPARRHSLHRAASWGHAGAYGPDPGFGPPESARADMWDENNLSRRPRDWRADFTSSGGIAAYIPQMLPSILKPKTDVKEWTDPERREVHPLLLYKTTQPPIAFDLRPGMHHSPIIFPTLDRPHNDIDMAQLACQPSAQFMRLVHPRLPWYVDVRPKHANGVTVGDVFGALMERMAQPIHGRHFWNEALSRSDRAAITAAFQERCRGRPDLVPQGVLFVDFLGDRYIFLGLQRVAKGLWQIHTERP